LGNRRPCQQGATDRAFPEAVDDLADRLPRLVGGGVGCPKMMLVTCSAILPGASLRQRRCSCQQSLETAY
jgi:hypothetical protein